MNLVKIVDLQYIRSDPVLTRITFKPLRSEDTHYMALGMNYSTAGFELILSRKMSFYIITYYLPSGLFVGISWVSFLINPEVIPGRMTMLVTLFLVLINIHNTIQTNSPKVRIFEALISIECCGCNWTLM